LKKNVSVKANIKLLPFVDLNLDVYNNDKKESKSLSLKDKVIGEYEDLASIICDYKYICEYIGAQKETKFIIIFDELDRCSTENILELLTIVKQLLIRSNPYNVFYLAGINKAQIDSLLDPNRGDKVNSYKENYVDKIFDYYIDLEKKTEC